MDDFMILTKFKQRISNDIRYILNSCKKDLICFQYNVFNYIYFILLSNEISFMHF